MGYLANTWIRTILSACNFIRITKNYLSVVKHYLGYMKIDLLLNKDIIKTSRKFSSARVIGTYWLIESKWRLTKY